MKNYFFVGVLIALSVTPSITSANWDSFTEFKVIDNRICKVYDTNIDCLEGADVESFGKFENAKSLFGESGQYVYADKYALYFFPVNDEWRRIEIDHSNLKSLGENYFSDGSNVYYASFPFDGIKKIGPIRKSYSFLGNLLIRNNRVYYRGEMMKGIRGERLVRDTKRIFGNSRPDYFIHGSIILIDQGFSFIRLRGVDIASFRKTLDGYEDKKRIYKKTDGHYGFDLEIIVK